MLLFSFCVSHCSSSIITRRRHRIFLVFCLCFSLCVCVCLYTSMCVCVWFVAVRSCGGDCGKRQTAAAAARTSFERTPLGRVVTSIAISLVHAHLNAKREISCLCLARSRSLTLWWVTAAHAGVVRRLCLAPHRGVHTHMHMLHTLHRRPGRGSPQRVPKQIKKKERKDKKTIHKNCNKQMHSLLSSHTPPTLSWLSSDSFSLHLFLSLSFSHLQLT